MLDFNSPSKIHITYICYHSLTIQLIYRRPHIIMENRFCREHRKHNYLFA